MTSGEGFEARIAPLWAAARAGDEAAYRAALALVAERLRAYFRRRLPAAPQEAEDLVQETLLAVHLKRDTHDPGLPLANWLHAIARYRLADHWRRKGRRPEAELSDDLAEAEETAEGVGAAMARRDLGRLLADLPEGQRQAIELVKLEGLSTEEAAARMGIPAGTLKVRIHRGLAALMARFAESRG